MVGRRQRLVGLRGNLSLIYGFVLPTSCCTTCSVRLHAVNVTDQQWSFGPPELALYMQTLHNKSHKLNAKWEEWCRGLHQKHSFFTHHCHERLDLM